MDIKPESHLFVSPFDVDDQFTRRIVVGCAISIIVNASLWSLVSHVIRNQSLHAPQLVEITRVILPPKTPVKKVVPPKRHPPHIIRPVPKPPVAPRPILRKPPPPIRTPPPRPRPPAPHHHFLTGPAVSAVAEPHEFTAQSGGTARVGAPVEGEGTGNTRPAPPPAPAPPPHVEPKPAPPPPVVEPIRPVVKPAPVEPRPAPPPPPPPAPKPVGETRDALPDNEVKPDIPDDLKSQEFKSAVRVRVVIEPDGSFTPVLRTSSGNAEIDRLVLDALKQWRWKPALQNGSPVESTRLFRFEFQVD